MTMTDDPMEELRIMADEHDDDLCRFALDRFAMLEEAVEQYRVALCESSSRIKSLKSDIESMNNNTRRLVGALRKIAELPSDRADESPIIAKFVLGDRI